MAKYKGREVNIVEELPHPTGHQVRIEHKEPGVSGFEIVPKNQVWVSEDEKKAIEKSRQEKNAENDFKVQGKDEYTPDVMPSVEDMKVQKMAEDNLKRNEEQAKEREDFQKKFPHAPAGAFEQYQTSKVAPASWEKDAKKASK